MNSSHLGMDLAGSQERENGSQSRMTNYLSPMLGGMIPLYRVVIRSNAANYGVLSTDTSYSIVTEHGVRSTCSERDGLEEACRLAD
jgi:hypothetical protein